MNKDIYILAIETSCDECACSIVKYGRDIISSEIFSQIDLHSEYGGVVPEIASRSHIEKIVPVVSSAIKKAQIDLNEIDAIAVTYGPGLIGSLLVGVNFAKSLAYSMKKPLIPVNHIEAHIAANYISNKTFKPPFISLVVSGGHTHLVLVKDYTSYEVIGQTRDDAAGEAIDKIARVLGLGYPGGPKLEKLASKGIDSKYTFPHAKVSTSKYDFSFSGVKSAVINTINTMEMKNITYKKEDIAASFQKNIIDVLVSHSIQALNDYNIKSFAIAGGVSANKKLREEFKIACANNNIAFNVPDFSLSTDNAAMVASQGYLEYIKGTRGSLSLNGIASLKIGTIYKE